MPARAELAPCPVLHASGRPEGPLIGTSTAAAGTAEEVALAEEAGAADPAHGSSSQGSAGLAQPCKKQVQEEASTYPKPEPSSSATNMLQKPTHP